MPQLTNDAPGIQHELTRMVLSHEGSSPHGTTTATPPTPTDQSAESCDHAVDFASPATAGGRAPPLAWPSHAICQWRWQHWRASRYPAGNLCAWLFDLFWGSCPPTEPGSSPVLCERTAGEIAVK